MFAVDTQNFQPTLYKRGGVSTGALTAKPQPNLLNLGARLGTPTIRLERWAWVPIQGCQVIGRSKFEVQEGHPKRVLAREIPNLWCLHGRIVVRHQNCRESEVEIVLPGCPPCKLRAWHGCSSLKTSSSKGVHCLEQIGGHKGSGALAQCIPGK